MRLRSYISFGLVFALAACGGAGGSTSGNSQLPATLNNSAGPPGNSQLASGAQHWQVSVGAMRREGALQALDFFPETITIDAGDSVTWVTQSIHTVSFLEGSAFTPFTAPLDPAGGNTEDGTAFTSSGILSPGQPYTLTFTTPGTYAYNCLLHPPEMAGVIVVQPAGTPYPHPQGFYTGQGNAAANSELSAAQTSLASFPYTDGGTTLAAGIAPGLAGGPPSTSSVWRFLDADNSLTTSITIPVGTTLTWVNQSNNEPHTVTFPVAGQPLPPDETPSSPATVNTTYDGSTLTNSGPFGTAVGIPFNSYSLTFTKRGTYTYFCLFHDDFGMMGTVNVI